MDSEKAGERHQTELKRQQSLSATLLKDQLAAMKSAHEQVSIQYLRYNLFLTVMLLRIRHKWISVDMIATQGITG